LHEIESQDDDPSLDTFMLSVFDMYGIPMRISDSEPIVWVGRHARGIVSGLPADGFT